MLDARVILCISACFGSLPGFTRSKSSTPLQVIVWRYPDTDRIPLAIETSHRANIFGVHILPCTNNSKIVSGAMDHTVQLHELPPADLGTSIRQPSQRISNGSRRHQQTRPLQTAQQRTTVYYCHSSRVKVGFGLLHAKPTSMHTWVMGSIWGNEAVMHGLYQCL